MDISIRIRAEQPMTVSFPSSVRTSISRGSQTAAAAPNQQESHSRFVRGLSDCLFLVFCRCSLLGEAVDELFFQIIAEGIKLARLHEWVRRAVCNLRPFPRHVVHFRVWCQENVGMYVLRPRECFLVVVDDARIGRVRDELVERNGRTAEEDDAPRG